MGETVSANEPGLTPLTYAQRPIWIGQRLDPDSPLYNMAFAFELDASLDRDAFRRAWRHVARSSDALRTRILVEGGHGFACIGDDEPAVDIVDDPASIGEDFVDWCRRRSRRPLPLESSLVDTVLAALPGNRTGWYLNQHHLIADAHSTALVYRRVAEAYGRVLSGEELTKPTPVGYYEAAAALLADSTGERATAHWAERRALGASRISPYGEPAVPSATASARHTLHLGTARSQRLVEICSMPELASLSVDMSGFALFAALLSGWLSRVGAATEVGFDAPVAGRPTPSARSTVGLFMEMFPFHTSVRSDDTFVTLAARCLAETQELLRHALPGLGSGSRDTAANVVLNYVPVRFGEFAGIPAQVEWVHPDHADRIHALRLQVHDFSASGSRVLHFDFNETTFSERRRRRAVGHFERLLDAMLEAPGRQLAEVDLLCDGERSSLGSLEPTTSAPLPDRSVLQAFFEQAETTPERVAVRENGRETTFASLRRAVEAEAARLRRHGVQAGDRVALLAPRSRDVVVGLLGALRAGAAYVPLDPGHPPERIAYSLRDCEARLLLAGDEVDTSGLPEGTTVLPLAQAGAATELSDVLPSLPLLDDLAYVMYTSGSSGRPKGVLVEHRGLSDYIDSAARTYVRGERLAFPLFTSLAFDLTVTSLFLPLVTGGTLEIYPETEGPVDTALLDVVDANAVDFIKLTPSHLSLLRRLDISGSRLRRMVVGGEDFKTALAAAVDAQFDGALEIYNEYGPTEAVVGCITHRFDPLRDLGARVPIGLPAEHVRVQLTNAAATPVPEGTPGELWLERIGLARGYLKLPELTAERFVPSDDDPARKRYRSGDRVRLTESGTLEFLGRVDRQVKVSGWRIEPGEIEAALLAVDGIDECAVVVRRGGAKTGFSPPEKHCTRCGLPSNFPRATFDADGICSVCRTYESIRGRAAAYFKSMNQLRRLFDESRRRHQGPYDCMMLLSGGKDSTYALARLVDMGLSVYAFTLDNGFIAEQAKDNIRRVTEQLGVPIEFATTPAMDAIFRDSLQRFSNVCHGCFKTIYTLSTRRADELDIPIIVTGLSRGQMFETRLTEEMFRSDTFSPEDVDAAVLTARRAYHRVDDEVARSLDVEVFDDDEIFERIRYVDFYRYCDTSLDEMLDYLARELPWIRPEDTGRSTNCLINDVGIWVHKRERGYHNYALPYSWDVRLGHKRRDAALEELDDDIDREHVRAVLDQIGHPEPDEAADVAPQIEAFYVASDDRGDEDVRDALAHRLPEPMMPTTLRRLDEIPLTVNGKVDERALPSPHEDRPGRPAYRRPEGPVQEFLAGAWQQELGVSQIGVEDDFFALGGTSLGAMGTMVRLCREFDIELPLQTLFTAPRLGDLARAAEQKILDDISQLSEAERRRLRGQDDH